jgi:hypothetical protein
MGVESVEIDIRARATDQARLEAALELAEKADVRSEVQVRMQHVALDEVVVVSVAVGEAASKEWVLVELKAGTSRTAQRHVVVVPIPQRNVFQEAERIGASFGVLEIAVVLVIAEELVILEVGTFRRLAARPQTFDRSRSSGCVG